VTRVLKSSCDAGHRKDSSCSKNPYVRVCPKDQSLAKCSHGIDNDGYGFVDCGDFGCTPKTGTPSTACL
jgi:hypothetical protein